MSTDNKLREKIPFLIERAKKFIDILGINVDIRVFDEDYCDPRIEFGYSGLGVSVFKSEHETIEYCAFQAFYDPGVRYYADGSGEPPSVELEALGESGVQCDVPLIEAIKAYVEFQLWQVLEKEDADAEAERCNDS